MAFGRSTRLRRLGTSSCCSSTPSSCRRLALDLQRGTAGEGALGGRRVAAEERERGLLNRNFDFEWGGAADGRRGLPRRRAEKEPEDGDLMVAGEAERLDLLMEQEERIEAARS